MGFVDSQLSGDDEYDAMGAEPVDRVRTLLSRLDSIRRGGDRGYEATEHVQMTSYRFVGRVEKIFRNLPKPLKWQSFYAHDLNLLVDTVPEVKRCPFSRD